MHFYYAPEITLHGGDVDGSMKSILEHFQPQNEKIHRGKFLQDGSLE